MISRKLNQLFPLRRNMVSESSGMRDDAPVVCLDGLSKSFVEAESHARGSRQRRPGDSKWRVHSLARA